MTVRRHHLVGAASAVGVFLATGTVPLAAAPTAHADLDDLFQPIINAVDSAVYAIDPMFGIDDAAGSALATSLTDPLTSLDALLFGGTAGAAAAADPGAVAAGTDVPENFTVPLTVGGGTEPTVDVSVAGGAATSVLVDTGSNGLLVPWQDVNWSDVGTPTHLGVGAFAGGLDYVYLTLPATVGFTAADGAAITTGSTPVDVELFAFPTTLQGLLTGDFTLNSFLGGNADGILGVGPNAAGPGPSSPITALPGDLNEGVLIDQPGHQLVFGPDQLTGGTAVSGAPNGTLEVSINGGTPSQVPALMDSGGVYGTLPDSLFGGSSADGLGLKPGTVVDVSTSDGQPLYSYTVDNSNSPVVTPSSKTVLDWTATPPLKTEPVPMNTGNIPFQQMPIYISNSPDGQGTTIFGGTS